MSFIFAVSSIVAISHSTAKQNCHYRGLYYYLSVTSVLFYIFYPCLFLEMKLAHWEKWLLLSPLWNEPKSVSQPPQKMSPSKFGRRPWSELLPSGPPAIIFLLFYPAGQSVRNMLSSCSHLFFILRQQTKGLVWQGLKPSDSSHRLAHFTSAMWLLDRSLEPNISQLPEVNCFIACYQNSEQGFGCCLIFN